MSTRAEQKEAARAKRVAAERALRGWWEPVIKPSGADSDRGLVVLVVNGQGAESTVGRVAWSRTQATGWFKLGSFKRSLRRVLARAEAECARLNA